MRPAAGPATALLLLGAFLLPGPRPAGGREVGSSVVALVGGATVTADDLSAFWHDRYREEWRRTVQNLVDERIVEEAAQRWGLAVPGHVVSRAVSVEVEARRAQLQARFGEAADLEEAVRRAYGTSVAAWREEILRPRLRLQALLERVVRLDGRRRPQVLARVIVVDEEGHARRLGAKLAGGADFSLVAARESVDPSGKAGGVLPPVSPGDLAVPDVEARLLAAPEGALLGPFPVTLEGRTRWHLYKVVRRLEPWSGPVAALAARLEEDLQREPVTSSEHERWRARVAREQEVRLFDPLGRQVR